MSYIGFESEQGRVQIGGREHARLGGMLNDLAWVMHTRGADRSVGDDYQARLRYQYPMVGDEEGNRLFRERLGWACLVGNDEVKLLAHIYGQCEINGWVHPDDLEWFAVLIEGAYVSGLVGDDGREQYDSWIDLASLAKRSTSPLVSDYSVTSSWPDPYAIRRHAPALFAPPDDVEDLWDAWEALSDDDRRRIAAEALPICAPRWHPAELGTHWRDLVIKHARAAWRAPALTGGAT